MATGGPFGTLNLPLNLSKAQIPFHQWTPREIVQEARHDALPAQPQAPSAEDFLNIDPIAFSSSVNQPSQWSSGYFEPGTPSLENADDWGFTAALANAQTQEPMWQHLLDFGKNIATLPITTPAYAAGKALETPAAMVLNALADSLAVESGVAPPKELKFQPGVPVMPGPPKNENGVLPEIWRLLSGMTTPGSLATFALVPESKIVQEGFLANSAASVPDSLEKMATANNADEFKDAATELGLNLGMTALMARGMGREGSVPDAEAEQMPSEQQAPSLSAQPETGNTAPPANTAKVSAHQAIGKPISQKIDDLAAVVRDIKNALSANQILSKPSEPTPIKPTQSAYADQTSRPAQDTTVLPAPVASDRPAFSPSGESNLTPNQIQHSITEAINEKHAKINVANANNLERPADVVRRQAESAFSEVRKGRAILANTVHDPAYYGTEIGQRLQAIAGQNGLRVIFYKGDGNSPKGFFNPEDGNLYLRTSAAQSEMAAILEHEGFHQRAAVGDVTAQRVIAGVDVNSLGAQKIAAKYNSWLAMHGKPPLSPEKLREEIGAFHVSGQNYEGIAPSDAFSDPIEALIAAREYHGASQIEGPPFTGDPRFLPGNSGEGKGRRTPGKASVPVVSSGKIPTIGGRIPINSRYAGQTHPSGIKFNSQGFPDFSPYAILQVEVDGLTGRYATDELLANKAAGLKKTPAKYVWHHVPDGKTMQLIPRRIHKLNHTGGSAVIRNKGFDK